ncbi:MAG: energy-coupling factor ABC transporter substrate-binding protein, partial [Gemmobacter sp.]|nr:energy-coupling factor ABC transporter substrate-binding protein [Gemmobacter sp.]
MMSMRAVWMLLVVVLLSVIPLLIGGEFAGADSEAAAIIEETEGFAPWFTPIWEPPSGEVASLLFSLQAALGGLVLGFAIGRVRGRRRPDEGRDTARGGALPPQV